MKERNLFAHSKMGIISILGAADCAEPGDTICEIREKKSETD